jgi:polysaccharide biosynthesis protein PslH
MRILFLCHRFPYPPNEGGKIRAFNMLRHLNERHSVVVASLAHSQQELQTGKDLQSYCQEVVAEIVPQSLRWARAARALATSTPSSVAYFYSPRLQQKIADAWQSGSFNVLWVHCAFMAQYVPSLSGGFRVLDYADIDSAKWLAYARRRAFPLSWGYGLESRKLRHFEKEVARHFQHFTVTTAGELEEFQSFGIDAPCTIIPNGVDLDYFKPQPNQPSVAPVLAFLGRMDYFPNVDGVLYFAKEILPLIRRVVPDVKFRIIGSNPTAPVRGLASILGVSVTSFVSDVRTYLRDAAVAVVPLRISRGTQNKILESLAMGIPTVATGMAARGVQAVPGRDFLVADTPQEFAQRVIELLKSPAFGAAMARTARAHLEVTHSWSAALHRMDTILEESTAMTPIS